MSYQLQHKDSTSILKTLEISNTDDIHSCVSHTGCILITLLSLQWARKLVVLYKYYQSKISNPTLKKPVLSSSSNHASYTTTSTPTIMSSQLQNKHSTFIKKTVDFSNTYDIHSCVSHTGVDIICI